jgi:hypothetical protein
MIGKYTFLLLKKKENNAKIDIKNDLKDIRANIIRKELRKYHVFKGIFKGNFYYFKLMVQYLE